MLPLFQPSGASSSATSALKITNAHDAYGTRRRRAPHPQMPPAKHPTILLGMETTALADSATKSQMRPGTAVTGCRTCSIVEVTPKIAGFRRWHPGCRGRRARPPRRRPEHRCELAVTLDSKSERFSRRRLEPSDKLLPRLRLLAINGDNDVARLEARDRGRTFGVSSSRRCRCRLEERSPPPLRLWSWVRQLQQPPMPM